MINLSKEKDLIKRFQVMCQEIHNVIKKTKPDFVVLEDVSLQTNVATLTVLARVQGAILQSSITCNIPYKIYKPSSWRKVLGFNQGKGIARKQLKKQAIEYVEKNYKIKATEDIAESICIGTAFLVDEKELKENSKNVKK